MGERMRAREPRGIAKHNRKEKALARREGREPMLLSREYRLGPFVKPLKSPVAPIANPRSGSETSEQEPKIRRESKRPSLRDVMGAGSALSMELTKFRPPSPDSADHGWENISDKQVVRLLHGLEESIVANGIGNPSEIAEVGEKLKGIIGPFGSRSTEIDMAAFGVLEALRLAKKAGGKVKETETTK